MNDFFDDGDCFGVDDFLVSTRQMVNLTLKIFTELKKLNGRRRFPGVGDIQSDRGGFDFLRSEEEFTTAVFERFLEVLVAYESGT